MRFYRILNSEPSTTKWGLRGLQEGELLRLREDTAETSTTFQTTTISQTPLISSEVSLAGMTHSRTFTQILSISTFSNALSRTGDRTLNNSSNNIPTTNTVTTTGIMINDNPTTNRNNSNLDDRTQNLQTTTNSSSNSINKDPDKIPFLMVSRTLFSVTRSWEWAWEE
mmetsp:Transcript_26132/g.36089  ORF Transcript_26132/g.36089 Transcript_26132/m.36089 type:complete len:168 (-) Transcript_26132:149-652(-)